MRRRYFGAMVIVAMVLFTFAVWGRLPDRIPIPWNVRGEVDGWAGKWPGAFLLPAVSLGLWLLFRALPRIDPRRENYERFEPTYWTVANVVLVFMALVHVLALGTALDWSIDAPRVILVALGSLFVAAGLVTIGVALLSPQSGFALMFAALVLAALVPLVYSYMAWRRERT